MYSMPVLLTVVRSHCFGKYCRMSPLVFSFKLISPHQMVGHGIRANLREHNPDAELALPLMFSNLAKSAELALDILAIVRYPLEKMGQSVCGYREELEDTQFCQKSSRSSR